MKEIEVINCDKCCFSYRDSQDMDMTCTIGGSPDNRAKRPNSGEVVEPYPPDCPLLLKGSITVKLKL